MDDTVQLQASMRHSSRKRSRSETGLVKLRVVVAVKAFLEGSNYLFSNVQ